VLDGRLIHEDADLAFALSCALRGPAPDGSQWRGLPARDRRFGYDGFKDWLLSAWPPASVLVWHHHHQSRDELGEPVFHDLLEMLEECGAPYRLE
jgi:hypothetical protein